MNQVNKFFVREHGKYFNFKSSLFSMSPAPVWYLATCSMVDSSVSPANLVNLRTFHPLGNSVCKTKSGRAEEYVGRCRHVLTLFRTMICSMIASRFCSPTAVSCQTCQTTGRDPGYG